MSKNKRPAGKTFVAERVGGIANCRLPALLSREIGRVVVHWAYFEHVVQEMVWQILSLPPAAGRVAIRDQSALDGLKTIDSLIKLRKGQWDRDLFASVAKKTEILGQ